MPDRPQLETRTNADDARSRLIPQSTGNPNRPGPVTTNPDGTITY